MLTRFERLSHEGHRLMRVNIIGNVLNYILQYNISQRQVSHDHLK